MQKFSDFEIKSNREFCACRSLMNLKKEIQRQVRVSEEYDYFIEIVKILECPACHSLTIVLYSTNGNSQDDSFSEYYERDLDSCERYTRRLLYTPKETPNSAIPAAISEVIQQAESVVENSPRASFILCRAAIEEICNDFKIPSKDINRKGEPFFISLKDRLSKLFLQEQISQDLITVIEGIRELGNEGTHSDHLVFSCQVTDQDAKNLIDVVNYVAERLYINKVNQQNAEDKIAYLVNKILPSKD